MKKELKQKLWKNGKSAGDYPKDYIVIPVLDAIRIIERNEVDEK